MSVTAARPSTRPASAPGARVQPRRSVAGFWIAVALLLFAVASSALPSPLYPVYASEWGLSPVVLASAFAIYVVGLLVALLSAGSLSDFVGRRPVLFAGSLGTAVALVLFAFASDVSLLLVGRALQGLSVGLLMGAVGAAMLDHSLVRNPSLAGVLNGVVPPTALAFGALSSGALVEWGPEPKRLVYLVFALALLALTALVLTIPESVAPRSGAWRSLLPALRVPLSSRRLLRDVAGSLVASWALAGLYLSLVPSMLAEVFEVTENFASGLLIALFAGSGAVTGYVLKRVDPRRQQLCGLVCLIVGPIVTDVSVSAHVLPGAVVGTVIAGFGFGAGFQSGLRMLLATVEPSGRAGLLSAIYVISYLAFGVPSVVASLVEPFTGLVPALVGYGVMVVIAAGVALVLQRPFADRAEAEAAEIVDEACA